MKFTIIAIALGIMMTPLMAADEEKELAFTSTTEAFNAAKKNLWCSFI